MNTPDLLFSNDDMNVTIKLNKTIKLDNNENVNRSVRSRSISKKKDTNKNYLRDTASSVNKRTIKYENTNDIVKCKPLSKTAPVPASNKNVIHDFYQTTNFQNQRSKSQQNLFCKKNSNEEIKYYDHFNHFTNNNSSFGYDPFGHFD
jgi:hypothetical protein